MHSFSGMLGRVAFPLVYTQITPLASAKLASSRRGTMCSRRVCFFLLTVGETMIVTGPPQSRFYRKMAHTKRIKTKHTQGSTGDYRRPPTDRYSQPGGVPHTSPR